MKLARWAVPIAIGATLVFAVPAAASTVQIQDDSHVLNTTTVQNQAASFPVPLYIWTTTQDAASPSTFDHDVESKVSSQFPVVIGINTQAHHESIQIGEASGLSQSTAISAEDSANSAFTGVMSSRNDYTGAVQAALTSLKSAFGSGSPRSSHGGGIWLGIGALIILVIVMAVLGRVFRAFRGGRRGYGGPPPGYGPGYGGGGYGPGYGPGYGGGYGGGGMSRGAAAGLGAAGGGFLGYELGKMAGENEQFRRDEMMGGGFDNNQGWDNNNGGGDNGGWVVGQDSDWGGGDSGGGGGDFGGGGGDNGGGSW